MESTTSQSRCFTIVFILGPPGSGKGTLCELVAKKPNMPGYRYHHLSVGDYLRELCETEVSCEARSFDCDKIRDHMRENKLLPADVLIPVLEHSISSTLDVNNVTTTWLIDGFPRNIETALAFEEKIGKPVKVIVLECARDIAQRRFLSRGRENNDDEKRFEKRYGEYVENTKAIREHYGDVFEMIRVDGSRAECLGKFISVLPRSSMD